jgi:lipopolysaccharide transport system ATP-binding protein
LGFAIAAHCEPDILLVDEVLAVGDYTFRNKCIFWLNTYSANGGTVILVSHNLWHIEKLCTQALLLNNGKIVSFGLPKDTISDYYKIRSNDLNKTVEERAIAECKWGISTSKELRILDVKLLDKNGKKRNMFEIGEALTIQISLQAYQDINNAEITCCIYREDGVQIHGTNNARFNMLFSFKKGEKSFVELRYHKFMLLQGTYYVSIGVTKDSLTPHRYDEINRACYLTVNSNIIHGVGITMMPHEWIKI